MEEPAAPENEPERLASLKDLDILDTPAEERFDRITRLAKKSLGTEMALISLVDTDRQWFKSAQGLSASETGRDISFCGHAILDQDAFVVPDAREDNRFADNPLVQDAPNIRLYAGQPIRGPNGMRIGTLCVIDSKPRNLEEDEVMLLQDLAVLVENELKVEHLGNAERELRHKLTEAERRASIDHLTRLWNRESIMKLFDMEIDRAARSDSSAGAAMVDIDHFKSVNDTYGHGGGDEVLAATAQRIRGAVRPYDSVGRYGGEEFVVVIVEPDPEVALAVGERIRQRIAAAPIEFSGGSISVTASVGVCSRMPARGVDTKALVKSADRALYNAKESGRNRVSSCQYEDS